MKGGRIIGAWVLYYRLYCYSLMHSLLVLFICSYCTGSSEHPKSFIHHESQIGPNAGIPLLSIPYTTFLVSFGLLITNTASASNSVYISHANRTKSGRPRSLVSHTSAFSSTSLTASQIPFPYVFSGLGVLHITRHAVRGISCITPKQGPIPDPVVTRTMRRKICATHRTPVTGIPFT